MPPHTKNIMMEAGDFSHGGLPSPHNGHGSSYEIGLDSGSTINTSSHHALQEAPPYSSHQSSTGSVNNSTPQRRRMERLKKLEERHGSTHVRRASTSGSLCGAPSHLATSGAPSNNAFEPSRIGTHVRRATTIGSLSGFRPGSNSEMGFALSRLGSSEGSCVRKVHLPNVDRVGSPCGSPSSNSNLSVVPSGTLSGATSQSGSNYSNENRHRLRLKKQSYHRRTQSEGSTVSLALAAAAASTTSAQYSTLDHSSGDAPRITVGSGGGDRDDAPVLVRKLMDSLEGRPPSSHAAAPAPAPSGPQHSQIPVQMQTRGEGDNTTSGSKQYHSQPNSPTELEHNYNGLSEKDLWALGISGHTMNPWGDLGRSKQKYRDHAKKSPSKAIPPVFQATSKSNQAMSASAKDNDDVTKHKSTSSQPLKGEGIDKASHSLLPGASTRRRYSLSEKSSVPMRRVPVNDLSVNDLSSSSRQQHYHSHHQSAGNDHALPPTAEAHPIHLEQAQTLPPPLPRPMRDQSHFDQKHPKQQKKNNSIISNNGIGNKILKPILYHLNLVLLLRNNNSNIRNLLMRLATHRKMKRMGIYCQMIPMRVVLLTLPSNQTCTTAMATHQKICEDFGKSTAITVAETLNRSITSVIMIKIMEVQQSNYHLREHFFLRICHPLLLINSLLMDLSRASTLMET
mmetsp:Transcript_40961/g.96154  ORF Transcript_40961/g.96154 Transcript_40961/m.96154 type:complete len:679 (+) Transcript_40961:203-2239(+)